jgi:DNA end-binding protein Ku
MVQDPVQERLLDIIAAKKKGHKRPTPAKVEEVAQPSNVINIMDALRRSVKTEAANKKR